MDALGKPIRTSRAGKQFEEEVGVVLVKDRSPLGTTLGEEAAGEATAD